MAVPAGADGAVPYVEVSCRQGVSCVRVAWPNHHLERTTAGARTAICVLTHDAKFDIPLLRRALTLPVGYVGAMGSRCTHEERLRLLREGRCRGTATRCIDPRGC